MFRMQDAFPPDDPKAAFIAAISMGFNDLTITAKRIVNEIDTLDMDEATYLLRMSFAQLHELRSTIRDNLNQKKVAEFVRNLPEEAQADLNRILHPGDKWIVDTISYVRNKTNHYGDSNNVSSLKWAMRRAADGVGMVELAGPSVGQMKLEFAYTIVIHHISRKFPEYYDDT